jgi:hypothetical protein
MDEIFARIFGDLEGRVGGPLTFRLILQPLVAATLAIRAGLADARAGRPAYFWSVMTDPDHRRELLSEGWKAIAKVFVLALVIDAIYQVIVLRRIYPGEAVIVAILLSAVPYLLLRGPVTRLYRDLRGNVIHAPAERQQSPDDLRVR